MSHLLKICSTSMLLLVVSAATAWSASAELEAYKAEVSYILNTLLFLVMGVLVMFMAAGFAMLEAGMVRTRSVVSILIKNISLYSVAGLMFMLCGYNLMYSEVNGYIGQLGLWMSSDPGIETGDFSSGYSSASDWFFQMVFVATTASIISGALAERIRLVTFLLFVVVLTGFIYPVVGAWKWGGGWLDIMGFQDFAGSTIVHSVGGWAALVGAVLLGSRAGRYVNGEVKDMPASSLPLVTLGTFILWLGWFGFNGGSQLALGTASDAIAVSNIFINTNMAAASGVMAALVLTRLLGGINLGMVLNGALGGLVSITAEPLAPTIVQACLIGAVGGVVVVLATNLLEKIRIDDVVGAIPVHLCCGIWGTMIVPLTNTDATYLTQLIGVASIGGFVVVASLIVWLVLRFTLGLRVADEIQVNGGTDHHEFGAAAYPEFTSR